MEQKIDTNWPFASSPLGQFASVYTREHATTRKVLDSFPSDQSSFRPHGRSNSAHQIAWTFVLGEKMMLRTVLGEQVAGSAVKAPESWDEIVRAFDEQHEQIKRELKSRGDAALTNKVQFFLAPKQPGEFPAMDFIWFLLCDQIHHRGQLSVYVRMAGGKLPSIYGPTADEPWT